MRIQEQSPTRIDLAGGTLDCWPLYLLVDGAKTINLSIDINSYVSLEVREDSVVDVEMVDLGYRKEFSNLTDLLNDPGEELCLVRRHLAFWKPTRGFSLRTRSESPLGGGLGGSSSLSISLIKAFSRWMGAERFGQDPDLYQKMWLASNLEAQVLHKPTGTQDYFPALSPGLNTIHYTPMGPRLEPMTLKPGFFEPRLTLVYTGKPHHSGLNNWAVLKAALDRDEEVLRCLRRLKDVAEDVYRVCKEDRWEALPELFQKEYEARVALSPGFTSPEIKRLTDVVLREGAQAVKICGAGGGGCVFVWSDPERKAQVDQSCRNAGFEVLSAKPVLKSAN